VLGMLGYRLYGRCVVTESARGRNTYYTLAGGAKWPENASWGILGHFGAILGMEVDYVESG